MADAIYARGEAEAEALSLRAEAYRQFNEAAIVSAILERLPEIVRAAAEPISGIESLTVLSTDGASEVVRTATNTVAQAGAVVQSLTGIDLRSAVDSAMSNIGEATKGGVTAMATDLRTRRASRAEKAAAAASAAEATAAEEARKAGETNAAAAPEGEGGASEPTTEVPPRGRRPTVEAREPAGGGPGSPGRNGESDRCPGRDNGPVAIGCRARCGGDPSRARRRPSPGGSAGGKPARHRAAERPEVWPTSPRRATHPRSPVSCSRICRTRSRARSAS